MNPKSTTDTIQSFQKLLDLIATLRSENGCPWDKKQTPATFHPYILEEYHEMVQAINNGSHSEISDELGDLLFLVVFVAYMFQQQGVTTLEEIMQGAVNKMTRRHPHVFGDVEAKTPGEVIDNWAKIKASEENIRVRESLLDGIPRSLPALNRAQKLARRAARVGFDWTRPEEVFAKVDEELRELKEALASGVGEHIKEELGDLLFVVVNAARHLEINSEVALTETSDKFERRFRHIETRLREQGKSLEQASLEEMDALWDEAKSKE
ncbi:MAG: nucleoside triphosphate pyrophosphohydrolase [Desulfomonile tiedjei]|uniref:Nucleoside triphosphate pyrophosphohydrolase n=1 Tax=Desulfomonile tiedjei TaxID=2358 RepID=A0A9D6V0V9_9BACT|nr:nucleoside triphosphate pyrophosphohydrolase [Desulfomonile tiedjei]